MSSKFTKGALVWVKHPSEAWQPATVGEVLPKGKIQVFFANGKEDVLRIQADHPLLRTIACEGDIEFSKDVREREGGFDNEDGDDLFSDDLTKMTQLITPAVLYTLSKSYTQGRFYSKLGSGTVLALNPFKDVPDLFTLNTIQSYHSVSLSELQHLPAHVYAAAQGALVTLRASVGKVNQSLIVSGESGAGKTWTVRCLMRYLAEVGIEYKRRLSSTDLSCTPLKGFHVTPIRSSIKSSVLEGNRRHPQDVQTLQGVITGGIHYKSLMFKGEMGVGDPIVFPLTEKGVDDVSDENGNFNNNNKTGIDIRVDEMADSYLEDVEDASDLNTSIKIVDRIERRILYSNPILEAFGNAHTLRNENSSRFGKYIQLQYDRSGTIVGAQLRTYLLEKTRAVRHDPGERSYHIFYQMLHGASDEEKKEWNLPNCPFPEDNTGPTENFLYGGGEDSVTSRMTIDQKKQKSDFEETCSSMSRIGISDETQFQIFKLLSAVLHLRLLTFEGTDDLQNACTLEGANPVNETSLKSASELLGVEEDVIMKAITFREITAHSNRRKSVFHRPCTVQECDSRRDSLAKLIYEKLFHWIVDRVGDSVCAPPDKWCSFIGLLDVYGFESFENNSLEQLCINYANEKLQQHFVASFLREQQEEYIFEGVTWTHCDLTDNVECLLSLESPRNSLFSLLNEECRLNRARAGAQLKSRVESMFKRNRYIVQPRISTEAPSFSVVHYAGHVNYRTDDLIEKNKDEVPPEITQLLMSSGNGFVNELFGEVVNENDSDVSDLTTSTADDEKISPNKGKHRPTVLTRFKKSLDDLLETLGSTDCHYIRCIKPNKQSMPDIFDAPFVLGQLEACGVVETIRVCAPAHPNKMNYNEFLARYGFLLRKEGTAEDGVPLAASEKTPSRKKRRCVTNVDMRKNACERILSHLQGERNSSLGNDTTFVGDEVDPLQYGKTMIFMSSQLFEALESARSEEIVKCAVTVQRVWRAFVHQMRCRAQRKIEIEKRNNAATLLQRAWRDRINIRKCRLERRELIKSRLASASRLQRFWTAYKRRSEARIQRRKLINRRQKAVVTIQSVFRGWKIRCKYKDLMDAWMQLKLIPEEEYRKMIQKRLRLLLGPQLALSPSPTYEAIKASFEMPSVVDEGSPKRAPSDDSGYSNMSTPGENTLNIPNTSSERVIVYYDDNSSQNVIVKENVQDNFGPDDNNLGRNLHPPSTSLIQGSPNAEIDADTSLGTPSQEEERPLRSTGVIRHAKLIRNSTNTVRSEKVDLGQKFNTMPRLPKGPGVIYAWHNRAAIMMMTSKRPMSLSSDPLTLLEMQFNESVSVLTTPFSSLRSTKRSHSRQRRVKHRHSDRQTQRSGLNQSGAGLSRISPSKFSWSPKQWNRVARSGSGCILKYADVAPRIQPKDARL